MALRLLAAFTALSLVAACGRGRDEEEGTPAPLPAKAGLQGQTCQVNILLSSGEKPLGCFATEVTEVGMTHERCKMLTSDFLKSVGENGKASTIEKCAAAGPSGVCTRTTSEPGYTIKVRSFAYFSWNNARQSCEEGGGVWTPQ